MAGPMSKFPRLIASPWPAQPTGTESARGEPATFVSPRHGEESEILL